jgi:multiple sugar transport system permease protein
MISTNRRFIPAVGRWATLLILAALTVFPLVWVLSSSLKPLSQVFTIPVQWVPDPVQPQNYPDAIQSTNFLTPLVNSVLVTLGQLAINLPLCTLAGYGFAKFDFRFKELIFVGVLAMTLLPLQVIMIPLFLIVRDLGWINSYQGLIVPTAASAFGVFFMRQFIGGIPDDYIAAARVDGANERQVLWHVIVPQSVPALVTLGVLVTLSSWDEFLWPLIVVRNSAMATAPLALAQLRSDYQTPYHFLLALAIVMALPPLLAFLLGQRRIMESVTATGLK